MKTTPWGHNLSSCTTFVVTIKTIFSAVFYYPMNIVGHFKLTSHLLLSYSFSLFSILLREGNKETILLRRVGKGKVLHEETFLWLPPPRKNTFEYSSKKKKSGFYASLFGEARREVKSHVTQMGIVQEVNRPNTK